MDDVSIFFDAICAEARLNNACSELFERTREGGEFKARLAAGAAARMREKLPDAPFDEMMRAVYRDLDRLIGPQMRLLEAEAAGSA
jgi:hypothetical protein